MNEKNWKRDKRGVEQRRVGERINRFKTNYQTVNREIMWFIAIDVTSMLGITFSFYSLPLSSTPRKKQLSLLSLKGGKYVWVCVYFIMKCLEHWYSYYYDRLQTVNFLVCFVALTLLLQVLYKINIKKIKASWQDKKKYCRIIDLFFFDHENVLNMIWSERINVELIRMGTGFKEHQIHLDFILGVTQPHKLLNKNLAWGELVVMKRTVKWD